MANLKLWDFVKEVKGTGYKWVDLTHELSPDSALVRLQAAGRQASF